MVSVCCGTEGLKINVFEILDIEPRHEKLNNVTSRSRAASLGISSVFPVHPKTAWYDCDKIRFFKDLNSNISSGEFWTVLSRWLLTEYTAANTLPRLDEMLG